MKTIFTILFGSIIFNGNCQESTMERKLDVSSNIIYYSALSKFDPQPLGPASDLFIDSYRWDVPEDLKDRRGKVQFPRSALLRLFYAAYGDTLWNYPHERHPITRLYRDTILFPRHRKSYGKYWYKPILAVKDSSAFEQIPKSAKNKYNYILQAPLEKASARFLQKAMQKDLELYFDYETTVEDRMMPCWNITVSPKGRQLLQSATPEGVFQQYEDELGDLSFKNAEMRDIILILESPFGHGSDSNLLDRRFAQPPFFDATGIRTPIDFSLNGELMTAIFSHHNDQVMFDRLVAELQRYGLQLTKGKRMMKVVVIRDRKNSKK